MSEIVNLGQVTQVTVETVEIPDLRRKEVDERDQGFCRFCGKQLDKRRGIHHIRFGGTDQGTGGRRNHSLDNLISVCWLPPDAVDGTTCHQRLHADKYRWLGLAAQAAVTPGLTVLQLERWNSGAGEGEEPVAAAVSVSDLERVAKVRDSVLAAQRKRDGLA